MFYQSNIQIIRQKMLSVFEAFLELLPLIESVDFISYSNNIFFLQTMLFGLNLAVKQYLKTKKKTIFK